MPFLQNKSVHRTCPRDERFCFVKRCWTRS